MPKENITIANIQLHTLNPGVSTRNIKFRITQKECASKPFPVIWHMAISSTSAVVVFWGEI